jgi:Flp pilus assembly pilin Flp
MKMILKKVISQNQGQSVLEYIILTSLVGVFCLIGIKTFGERVKKRIDYVNTQVTKQIQIR